MLNRCNRNCVDRPLLSCEHGALDEVVDGVTAVATFVATSQAVRAGSLSHGPSYTIGLGLGIILVIGVHGRIIS